MLDKLYDASAQLHANPNDSSAKKDLDAIDMQTVEIQAAGEKQCRKFCTGLISFSLLVNLWIHEKWAYQALARVAMGRCNNVGNALRRAKRAGITNVTLTHDKCLAGIEACRQWLKALSTSACSLRKVHLRDCLINAEDFNDEITSKVIRKIILQED